MRWSWPISKHGMGIDASFWVLLTRQDMKQACIIRPHRDPLVHRASCMNPQLRLHFGTRLLPHQRPTPPCSMPHTGACCQQRRNSTKKITRQRRVAGIRHIRDS